MPIFGKRSFQPAPRTPQPGPTPPKFNPPDWTTPVPRPSLIRRPSPIQGPAPIQKPMAQKPLPSKPAPQKPKTLFEEKKDWGRIDFLRRTTKAPFTSRGKMYSSWERKKMIEEALPSKRFSTYISEREAKTRLRELRREEYRAKTGVEKSKLSNLRKYLEKQTGLQGKY